MATLHELTDRDRIRKIVNDYAEFKNKDHRTIYNILYSAVENAVIRRHQGKVDFDIHEGARSAEVSRLVYLEQTGLINETLAIARDIFREVTCDENKDTFFAETGS